jgi:hypothetical protein
MVPKRIKRDVPCWPTLTTNIAFDDASVIQTGETVYILEGEAQRDSGRLPVWVREQKLFCSHRQFWAAAE